MKRRSIRLSRVRNVIDSACGLWRMHSIVCNNAREFIKYIKSKMNTKQFKQLLWREMGTSFRETGAHGMKSDSENRAMRACTGVRFSTSSAPSRSTDEIRFIMKDLSLATCDVLWRLCTFMPSNCNQPAAMMRPCIYNAKYESAMM